MTQRYVAPIQIVSVTPDSARYSVQEDRRKPVPIPSTSRQPEERAEDKSSRRDFRALGQLVLLVALAIVVVISTTL